MSRAKINEFRKQKTANIEQKSKEWLELRNNYITASSVYKLFDKNEEYIEYLKEKASGISSFKGNDATNYGEIFEPVARDLYMYLTGEYVEEFGLLTNPDIPYCAVSPDGVTESDRLLEIKCPYTRVITGVVPQHYYHQIQLQLAVCDCDECDFIECKFKEITKDDFNKKLKQIKDNPSKLMCLVKTHKYKVNCFINGPPNTIENKCKFDRYTDKQKFTYNIITDIPHNAYWTTNIKPVYYELDFISLQTVERNKQWVKVHEKELNETIPLVQSIRKDPSILESLKKCECEF